MKLWLYLAMKWIGSLSLGVLILFYSCQHKLADIETKFQSIYDIVPYPQEIHITKSTFTLSSNEKILYDSAFKNEAIYLQDYIFDIKL